jgi:hypothetical protein
LRQKKIFGLSMRRDKNAPGRAKGRFRSATRSE